MNKNLFLLVALCAVSSQSFSMEESKDFDSSASDVPSKLDSSANETLKILTPCAASDVSSQQDGVAKVLAPVAPSLVSKWTTLEKHPLRVSTQFPVVAEYAKGWTPCVDAACAGVVAVGLGYGVYSQRATLARGGKSVASGVATAASATKSGLVSAAKATPGAVKYGAGSAVSVAGKVSSVALYPVKEALAHKTATMTGAASVAALVVGLNALDKEESSE